MVRLVFRHLAADERFCLSASPRAFARVSPDFAFFRHISRFFPRVTTNVNHSQDHGRWHVQMCVFVSVSVSVRVCACGKTLKTREKREMRVVVL